MTYAEARIHAINAEVAALIVEVEAMNAANLERDRHGKAPAYGEEAFQKKAEDIRANSFLIQHMADRLG